MAFVVLLVVFVPMLVEARRAARNERARIAMGGVEPAGDVYRIMRVAYPAAFLAMIVEGALRQPARPLMFAAGIVLFALAKALKWWAIFSLGQAWTFRLIVVPTMRLVETGPYRFVRHPNYIGVIGELAAVAMMTGARVTGPITTVFFGILILRRIAVENPAIAGNTPRL
jgi:methyltransferase